MMSDAGAQQDPTKAAGQALGGFLSWFSHWLNTQSALAVFAILMLVFVLTAVYWFATEVIPDHIERINNGYKQQSDSHNAALKEVTKSHAESLDKMMAGFKEAAKEQRDHDKELIGIIRDDRKPIAVNPLGGS